MSRLDIDSSGNASARTPRPASPHAINMHHHRSRRGSSLAAPMGSYDSDTDNGPPEPEQRGDSSTRETPLSVQSRSTPPLQPSPGYLNVDPSYTSHSPTEERRRNQSISRRDSTGYLAAEEMKDDDHYQTSSSFAKSSREATYSARGSAQLVDSTYQHAGPSLQHSTRSPSPLLSPPLSPPRNTSSISPSTSTKAKLKASSSAQRLAFPDRSSTHSAHNLSKYRETTRLSGTRTPSHASHSDDEEYRPESPSRRTPRPSRTQNTPRGLVEEHTPPFKSLEIDAPTPSSWQTPRASRMQFRPLSPTDDPPELPMPSSDDESNHESWNPTVTPMASSNGRQEPSWLPTPKPPGGWLRTPMAPRSTRNFDDSGTSRKASAILDADAEGEGEIYTPETPATARGSTEGRYMAKTPRPPGGWQTPAPLTVSGARFQASSASPEEVQAQGLLTPVSSISKGSLYDPKTPYVPGGWTATPAPRKSVMKVRFNHEEELPATGNVSPAGMQNGEPLRNHVETGHLDVRSSPRSPRKLQTPNIRILDAFGREQIDNDARTGGSVDPNARTVQPAEDDTKNESEDLPNPKS